MSRNPLLVHNLLFNINQRTDELQFFGCSHGGLNIRIFSKGLLTCLRPELNVFEISCSVDRVGRYQVARTGNDGENREGVSAKDRAAARNPSQTH